MRRSARYFIFILTKDVRQYVCGCVCVLKFPQSLALVGVLFLAFVRWPVVAVLSDRAFVKSADAKTLDMRDEHWQLMEDLLPVLKPFQMVTALMSTENTPSSSTVYPMIRKLKAEVLLLKPDDSATVQAFKNDLQTALTERFKLNAATTPAHPFVVASVLDPATKALENFDEEFKQAAYQNVRGMIPQTTGSTQQTGVEDSADAAPPPEKKSKPTNRSATMAFLGLSATSPTPDVSEFDRYLSTPVAADVDPLVWWGDNKSLFPRVASVAARFLAIPATSVMSERQFSAAGRLITKLRSRLDPERVDTIMFLYKNM